MKNLQLLLLFIFSAQIAVAQYFPDRWTWEEKNPSEVGLQPSAIDSAISFAIHHEYTGEKDLRLAILKSFSREPDHKLLGPTKDRGSAAGMIIKDGYIVARWGDLDRVDMTFSVTKSYLSTVVGLAFDDGLMQSLQDPVHKYVWDGTFAGAHNQKINWEHLLHQTSDWSGTLFGLNDWADRPDREGAYDSWKNREMHEPGSYFKYNDVRVNLLAYSLLQVWRKPLPQILKSRIMDPIGASTTWRWMGYKDSWTVVDGEKMQSVSGGGHHGGGVFINTFDQARMGLLFARKGKWNDQQLISENWVNLIQTPAPANASYGYMWWLNQGERSWPDVPSHLFYAAGFGGNYIVVDQQRDLVIVTRWLDPGSLGDFLRQVYQAVE